VENIDREILFGFVEEARGYLPRILAGVDALVRDPDATAPLEEAHRLMHSIKGASSMVGLAPLSHMAYYAEEALEQAATARPETMEDLAAVTRLAVERIGFYLDQVAREGVEAGPLLADVVRAFRRYRGLPAEGDQEEVEALLSPAATPVAAEPVGSASHECHQSAESDEDEPFPELLEIFQEEAAEHLQEMSRLLRRLEFDPSDQRVVQGVRRRIHTLKGAAGLVGSRRMAELAHSMEDLLDALYERQGAVSSEALSLLFRGVDGLEDLAPGGRGAVSESEIRELRQAFAALAGAAGGGVPGPGPPLDLPAGPPLAAEPERGTEPTSEGEAGSGVALRVPIERLDELVRSVSELVVHRSVFEQYLARLTQESEELGASGERLRRLSARLETEYEVEALASSRWAGAPLVALGGGRGRTSRRGAGEGFDPLEFDRYTQFHLLTRELAETASDINAVEGEIEATRGDFDAYLNRLERLTSEVQGRLLRLRMVPLQTLSSRLYRAVRTTAERQGKSVELTLEGERTELDKGVLEGIADPLLHLLRNAVYHGIEPPALRLAAGKPARGRIRVAAAHEGTQIVIRVEDDGSGIDLAAVAAAGLRGGQLSAAEAAALTPEAARELLFQPGFSTASEVSQISGRGVGLDVVKTEVHRLKGSISVVSTPGARTLVTIRLPLTLAVTRVLLVKAAGETLAVPFAALSRILRVEAGEVEALGEVEVVRVEGQVFPLRRLADAMGQVRSGEGGQARYPLLFLQGGEAEVALLVDELVEAREVVVKTLGTLLRRVHGVSGATVLGDGSVVLILDPAQLAAAGDPARPGRAPGAETEGGGALRDASRLDVLVVDDSLSVRRVLSNLVRDAGWNPVAAKDGVEALEILQRSARVPDVILLDIEMPRMDGYELTATLRGQQGFERVPIVMLTSRAGEKHRRKAFELGATEYLVKPFHDDTLRDVVRRVTREALGVSPA